MAWERKQRSDFFFPLTPACGAQPIFASSHWAFSSGSISKASCLIWNYDVTSISWATSPLPSAGPRGTSRADGSLFVCDTITKSKVGEASHWGCKLVRPHNCQVLASIDSCSPLQGHWCFHGVTKRNPFFLYQKSCLSVCSQVITNHLHSAEAEHSPRQGKINDLQAFEVLWQFRWVRGADREIYTTAQPIMRTLNIPASWQADRKAWADINHLRRHNLDN